MRIIALAAILLAATACGPFVYKIDVQQGNYVTQDTAARLKKGMSKAEVKQILGTPLLADVFHANRWDYYFSNVKGHKAEDRTRFTVVFLDDKVVDFTGTTRPTAALPVGPSTPPPPTR
ncbi:MAG: outer membrane protein assembly factor BamE [Usitatibacter sp.]